MPVIGSRWIIILLLGAGLATAGLGRASDEPPPSASAREAAADQERPSQAESPPTPQTPSAVKPPPRPQPQSRPRKDFRPSEEIHVDKAVDFPADI